MALHTEIRQVTTSYGIDQMLTEVSSDCGDTNSDIITAIGYDSTSLGSTLKGTLYTSRGTLPSFWSVSSCKNYGLAWDDQWFVINVAWSGEQYPSEINSSTNVAGGTATILGYAFSDYKTMYITYTDLPSSMTGRSATLETDYHKTHDIDSALDLYTATNSSVSKNMITMPLPICGDSIQTKFSRIIKSPFGTLQDIKNLDINGKKYLMIGSILVDLAVELPPVT